MTHPDYNSAAELKQVLDANGFSMQKKFGQNFLINQQARNKLIDALDVQEGTKVWEVGPGLGAMTNGLLEKGADLTVFEIDRGFISLISQYFDNYSKVMFLKTGMDRHRKELFFHNVFLETFRTILQLQLLPIQSKRAFGLSAVYLQFKKKLQFVWPQSLAMLIILRFLFYATGLTM